MQNWREALFFAPYEKFRKVIELVEFGKLFPEITTEWPHLKDPNPKEEAEINNLKAQTDTALHAIGAIDGKAVAKRLSQDENSGYAEMDVESEEAEQRFAELENEAPDEQDDPLSMDAEFREEDHKRDDDGKFTEQSGSPSASVQKNEKAIQKYEKTLEKYKRKYPTHPVSVLENMMRNDGHEIINEQGVRSFRSYKEVKNKKDLVDYVKHQLNIELENDPNDTLNRKRDWLYTTIPGEKGVRGGHVGEVFSLLHGKFEINQHRGNRYWIKVRPVSAALDEWREEDHPRDDWSSFPVFDEGNRIVSLVYDKDQKRIWITLENGEHAWINEHGIIRGGLGKENHGKHLSELSSSRGKRPDAAQAMGELYEKIGEAGNERKTVEMGVVYKKEINDLKEKGLDVTGYLHQADLQSIRHAHNKHGDPEKEKSQGQIALTKADFVKVPNIIRNYDSVEVEVKGEQTDVIYTKTDGDAKYVVAEKFRAAKKILAFTSMRKFPVKK